MTIDEFQAVLKPYGYRVKPNQRRHQYLIKDWHDLTIGFISINLEHVNRIYGDVEPAVQKQIEHFANTPIKNRYADQTYFVNLNPKIETSFTNLNLDNRKPDDQKYPDRISLTKQQIKIIKSIQRQIKNQL